LLKTEHGLHHFSCHHSNFNAPNLDDNNVMHPLARWFKGWVLEFVPLRRAILWLGCVAWLGLMCSGCQLTSRPTGSLETIHLRLGNPSHGITAERTNTYLIRRPQYAALYNRQTNTADWVSWQLNSSWIGTLDRPPFSPDPELPSGWYRVVPADYSGSGFDRGHLVPAADRNRNPKDLAAVFYMSNIVPQAPDSNRGPWESLERYCRRLAEAGQELYIMAGAVGQGGTGKNGYRTAIAREQVVVPASLWKIVVVTDGRSGLRGITAQTRVIAVMMPNQQGIKDSHWSQFRTTVRDIEAKTGLDFLSNLPPELQDILETQRDRRQYAPKQSKQ
jgi:endonuclease G